MSIILAILVAILPSCAYEDSTNCYWDASDNGGNSFVDIGGTAYYTE